MDLSNFAAFDIHTTHYKEVDGIQIPVHILHPLPPPTNHLRPTIIYFHSGDLIRGAALYAPHFAHWILTYALLHSAIIILPEHRLLPESSGLDILSDIADFWSWFHTSLPSLSILSPSCIATPSHPLVISESAGAYLALQSALSQPALSQPKDTVSAIIMQNPMLDLSAPWYTEEYDKNMFGLPILPRSLLEEHLRTIEAAKENGTFKPVVSAAPPFRNDVMLSIFQQGRFPKFLGREQVLYPLGRIEDGSVDVQRLPEVIFVFHALEDRAVPVGDTQRFVQVMSARGAEKKLHVHYEEGADHGFEYAADVTLDTPWLRDGMGRVSLAWLG